MKTTEAIALTERFLKALESTAFISSDYLHNQPSEPEEHQRFPELLDIDSQKIRTLVVRGWLKADTPAGPNSSPKIHGGASFVILGPGPLWIAYEQSRLTVEIAEAASSKASLAIGVAIGSFMASAIWFFYTIYNGD